MKNKYFLLLMKIIKVNLGKSWEYLENDLYNQKQIEFKNDIIFRTEESSSYAINQSEDMIQVKRVIRIRYITNEFEFDSSRESSFDFFINMI